jgi:hypothetical protein
MTIVARRLYFLTMLKKQSPNEKVNLRNNVPSLPYSTTVNHKNYWKKKVSFYEEIDQGSMLGYDSLIDQTFSDVDAFSLSVGNRTAAGLSIVL